MLMTAFKIKLANTDINAKFILNGVNQSACASPHATDSVLANVSILAKFGLCAVFCVQNEVIQCKDPSYTTDSILASPSILTNPGHFHDIQQIQTQTI